MGGIIKDDGKKFFILHTPFLSLFTARMLGLFLNYIYI